MSLLINAKSISKAYGAQLLFETLSFSVFAYDHIGLIGPNGAGKSTLLKILAEIEASDEGEIACKGGLKIGYVPQTTDFPDLPPIELLLQIQPKQYIVEKWLSKVGFSLTDVSAAKLSGGWQKRLSIAYAMVQEPDVLLLDEPTNHLDLEGVFWLENFIKQELTTFIAVSHDRAFLQNLTNQIIEINPIYPQGLFSIKGSYENFLEKKELFIEGQMEQEKSIASKVRRESEWLKQNPKARTTKSRSRIDRAEELFEEYAAIKRRNVQKKAAIHFQASDRESKKLLVAKNVAVTFGLKTVFSHLDLTFTAGMRLGLMGANGSGKTTLLKLLADEIVPSQGTIKKADNLKIVYFDQHRRKLADHLTLHEALSPNGDYVTYQGNTIHVNGWCQRFLFPTTALRMPISKLSGGERARISIAKLMLEPADILLLDEPTNDLDITTLQVLEENLMEFAGAIVLITHDRHMLQKCCNLFLALSLDAPPHLYKEYSQWESTLVKEEKSIKSDKKLVIPKVEKRSFKQIEKAIMDKEAKHKKLTEELYDPQNMANKVKIDTLCKQIGTLEQEINELYNSLE